MSMDVDDESSKKTASKGDDLSQYHLDDYDDDGKATGEACPFNSLNILTF